MSQNEKGINNSLVGIKNENYINILKNENIELDNKLKKVNQLVSKLKIQISENEKQKNLILTTSNQKEIDLQNIKKQLEQTKSKVDELKNKNKENLILISNQNNILKNKSEKDTILELQKKITDLEFKLKSSSKESNKKFNILLNTHNYSMILEGKKEIKNENESLPDILGIKFENNNNKNDLFLTGRNELIEMKENNEKLIKELNILKNELNLHQNDKNNINIELEKYNKEKNELLENINKKNEILNNKINIENELNNNLMKQLIENKKIKNNLENIKIKYKNLEKDKKELENIILEQENKVNELSLSVQKIIELMNLKNTEIKNNQIYIKNLEETIKHLNKEFRNMRIRKKKDNIKEICKLKNQLEKLKTENKKLLLENNKQNYNSNFETQRNYELISLKNNHRIISRNYKIKNEDDNYYNYYKPKFRKIRIKSKILNQDRNINSAMKINNFINKRKSIEKDNKYELYPYKQYINNGNKNLNIINLNNIKIKNLSNLKYNKSVLDLHKYNKKLENIPKLNNNEFEDIILKKTKIKKINSLNNPTNASDDKTSNTENTNKNYIFQTRSSISNLAKIKENKYIKKNEIAEKEKIQEFKNLLQQIVSDIES